MYYQRFATEWLNRRDSLEFGVTTIDEQLPQIKSETIRRVGKDISTDGELFSLQVKTTYSIPQITPPPIDGNPFVWQSSELPIGIVFIIVGSIVGFIIIFVLSWFTYTNYVSHNNTKNGFYQFDSSMDKSLFEGNDGSDYLNGNNKNEAMPNSSYNEYFDVEKQEQLGTPDSNKFISQRNSLNFDRPLKASSTNFDSLNKRNSLFVSPTLEVLLQQQRKRASLSANTLSNLTLPETLLNKLEKSAYKKGHKRKISDNDSKTLNDINTTKSGEKNSPVK